MGAKIMPFIINMLPHRVDGLAFYPYDAALEQYLTFKSRFGTEVTLSTRVNNGAYLAVPRGICPDPDSPEKDFRTYGSKIKADMAPSWRPRENQLDIIPQIQALNEEKASYLLQAGTGIGKTVLAQLIITYHKCTTLIVVDQENILSQWRKAITTFTTIQESEIGYIQGDVCDVVGKKVVIAMIQSIHKRGRYPASVYRAFGLVIFDECHILGATEFSSACALFPAAIRVGLSATPKRQDGLEKVFWSHIGPIRIKAEAAPLKPQIILVDTGYKLPIVHRRDADGFVHKVQLPHTAGRLMQVYKDMATNDARNRLIANIVKQCYDAGRMILLWTDLKDDHHGPLEYWITQAGIPPGDIGRYTGGLSENERDVNSVKRVVLATYKATSKAVDCPWWDTGIMCTPHSDVEQIAGRILREHTRKQCASAMDTPSFDPEKKVPLLFDLVDTDSTVIFGYFKSRLKFYKGKGFDRLAGHMHLVQASGVRWGSIYAKNR